MVRLCSYGFATDDDDWFDGHLSEHPSHHERSRERYLELADGRLFRSENGNPIQPSTWWQVWQKVRAASLTPDQLASPLMKRPYDLRHSGITWRLNSGVPATEVAAWAGHSVEMLMRVYARCVAGLEGVWIGRMDQALHLEEP